MRVHTHTFVIVAGLGAAIAGFWGCGGDVITATGSTTGGTGGHATTGTGPASSSSTTTVASSVASSSSGGGNTCMQECALAQMCTGFDVCGAGMIDCANPTAQAMCVIDCIDKAMPNCSSFLGIGQTCVQMCMGPMDGGPPPDGGMSGMGCQICAGMNCMQAVGACFQDSASGCKDWLTCNNACVGVANPNPCSAACDAMYPNAKAEYDAVYACSCAKCPTQCAGQNPCDHGTDGGP